jgi:hypothetical protein
MGVRPDQIEVIVDMIGQKFIDEGVSPPHGPPCAARNQRRWGGARLIVQGLREKRPVRNLSHPALTEIDPDQYWETCGRWQPKNRALTDRTLKRRYKILTFLASEAGGDHEPRCRERGNGREWPNGRRRNSLTRADGA